MEQPSSIPVRPSGIPRPASRLPVFNKSLNGQSQLRQPTSTEQLRKKASLSSLSKPTSPGAPTLQKKTSRASLVRSTTPATSTTSHRASVAITSNRPITSSAPTRSASTTGASTFKKPFGRPPSRQTRVNSQPRPVETKDNQGEDVLGDLGAFRSASRASSRAGFREQEPENVVESDVEPVSPANAPAPRKSRPSLSERTVESLSMLPPSSPATGKGRRRSSFFNADNSMGPPSRPASAMGGSRRPTTSDGTPQAIPATPRRISGIASRGSLTAPGKRSVSAATTSSVATPSKPPGSRLSTQFGKKALAPTQNLQNTPRARPLSNSKTMTARTPKARPSLAGTFGEAISPPATALPLTPSPNRLNAAPSKTPDTSRRVSNSSAALREQISKAKAARRSEATKPVETPRKAQSSSGALREQIAKAKEAARRAHAAKEFGNGTPPREVPAVTENEFGIEPDPAEIAEFDFGLEDPFNQRGKTSKSLLRKRVDAARVEGRLNIAAMGLAEVPEEILSMYKYNPDDNSIAWGEVVDVTTIIAADNELASLPDNMFPDMDADALDDVEDGSPQFGGLQTLDLHGNVLHKLPPGMGRLTQLSRLNLSRNKLQVDVMDVVTRISSLRELKLADNEFKGDLPANLGSLSLLETLELQGNRLVSLPVEIRQLVHLRTLNVSENLLKDLPKELFTSVPIVELSASKNAFSGSMFDIDTIPHLQTLRLANNSLNSLCETGSISFPELKLLDVSTNRLANLPDMSSWISLATLLIGENKLTTVPEGFTSLKHLRNADFSSNDLTKLDENIALMESLENLTLSANPLRERKFLTMDVEDIKRDLLSRMEPSSANAGVNGGEADGIEEETTGGWQLTPSGTLDLSFNNLTEVDEEALAAFATSNSIRQLHLQQNYLSSIPGVLSQLTHLTLLDLSKNSIAYLTTEPLSLPKLRELRLPGNKLKSLDDVTNALSAPGLQNLDVSNNQIAGPLPALRRSFPELLLFMASDNAITEVSPEALEGLKIVNLSNNEIPRLEPKIGLLSGTLTSLDVEGNIFRVPNYAVLKKGTETVLAWLRDKIPSPTEEFFSPPSSA